VPAEIEGNFGSAELIKDGGKEGRTEGINGASAISY
jgi:hypothetical protein